MGAERTQKGAVGQQLAASGRARRAEKIRRDETGGGPNIGRDVSRGVMEDQMLRNDQEGKQKQGKGGRPGKPIDRRPMPEKPPRDTGFKDYKEIGGRPSKPPRDTGFQDYKEGRPFEPPMDGRPPSRPIRGDDQYGPGRPGRPIGDDNWATLPYFPGKGPMPGIPEKPIGGRPPVEKHPWGREDDPNYGRKKDAWHQRRKEMEMKRKEDMWRRAKERRGGTDLGPGRGDRLPEDPYFSQDRFDAFKQQGGQNLERPGAAATTLQDFMAQMANLRGGGMR
tara:strand:- start:308 stop:1144 length:837 start_codon:yes stop_codon:yes gene_type:complete